MKLIKELLSSKKFLAVIVGIIISIGTYSGIDLDKDTVFEIVMILSSYIVGQGIADNGKEKAKIENGLV